MEIPWLPEALPGALTWCADRPGRSCIYWREAKGLAAQRGIRAHGHFADGPGDLYAMEARRTLILLRMLMPDLDAIVLARDSDGDSERVKQGLEQARRADGRLDRIVVAVPHACIEAWQIGGFRALTAFETEHLAGLRSALGFDPTVEPERLRARAGERDPKRVLASLCADDVGRALACIEDTPLEVLEERGRGSGLSAFLDEVRRFLVPLVR